MTLWPAVERMGSNKRQPTVTESTPEIFFNSYRGEGQCRIEAMPRNETFEQSDSLVAIAPTSQETRGACGERTK